MYSIKDIEGLGTILGIWAHPDDEAWCTAGLMAASVKAGQRVACVTATCGESGQTADAVRWPQEDLAAIRRAELQASLAVLGITEHYWLDCKDGQLAATAAQPWIQRLAEIIADVAPAAIVTFGADGLTGHDDHKTIHRWTKSAMRQANSPAELLCYVQSAECYQQAGRQLDAKFNMYFNTDQPLVMPEDKVDICFRLTPDLLSLKQRALQAQASQMTGFFADSQTGALLMRLLRSECFMRDAVDK